MTTTLCEPTTAETSAVWHADWVVAFGRDDGFVSSSKSVRRWRSARSALAVAGVDGSDLRIAENGYRVALFSGLLTNVEELESGAGQAEAARVALELFELHGSDAFLRLRGPFALMVWDRERGTLEIGRDHVGIEPIFYARNGTASWVLSPSPDVLVAQPGVSRDPDAVAMSEWLCGWFPAVEDTAYRSVKRVSPGSAITFPGERTRRYWDLFDDAKPVEWLEDSELDRFEPVLRRAVGRSTQGTQPAIFLSGGLDSISVAMTAVDVSAAESRPLALSIVFPDKVSSEEVVQRGVGRQLGLEHVLVPFNDAVGSKGLLTPALELSGSWPQPMWNIWSPVYARLAGRAAVSGHKVILTGRGGDEWLTISPYLLADQLKRGDVAGMWRLLRMRQRSNNLKGLQGHARLVWLTACRPLGSAALDALAPRRWHERRRQRLLAERPRWVAPDPAVRRAMEDRLDRWIDPARPRNGFYHREGRTAVRHPAVTHDMEETQEFGRRHGVRMMHPFWDVDLIEMLHRVHPDLLMADGRSKSLLRRRVARRLPDLGLETRGKVTAGHIFRGVMDRGGPEEWKRLGGPKSLARIGVVQTADIEDAAQTGLPQRIGSAGRLWTLLNLENWIRQRT